MRLGLGLSLSGRAASGGGASLPAATAVATVNPTSNLLDHAIFQRDTLTGGGQGVGQGVIPLSFSAVTTIGTIHARCSSGGGSRGDMQAEWVAATIAATGAQTVSITGIDARLGWFYIDILDSSGTWQNGTVIVGMGDLTLGSGQSLMGGFYQTQDIALNTALSTGTSGTVTVANPNTRVFSTSDTYSSATVTGVAWSLPADGTVSLGARPGAGAAAYLHWMAVAQGCNQGFGAHGWSGSAQSDWQWTPTGSNNLKYTQLTRVAAAIGGKWRFQFWWQGHADSDSSVFNYANDMDYREFGASGTGGYKALNSYPRANVIRMVNTIPNLFLGPYYYGPMRSAQAIRIGGKNWCAAKNDGTNTNGIYVEMPGLNLTADPHPGQLGNIEAAKCLVRAILTDNLGPKLLSAARDVSNPNDLILTFQQTGTDFQLAGSWWKRVAVYISGSTMNFIGCSTGSRISTTQLRVTMTLPVGGANWGDANAFDVIMGAPWDGDLSANPSGNMIRDDRTDSIDGTNGRPFQTGTTAITAVALNGAGSSTPTANYPATAVLNKAGYIAPSSLNDVVMISPTYDTVEHKTGFGFPLIGGRGGTRSNQVALNGHGTVNSTVPMTLVCRIKAPTPGASNRTIINWGQLSLGYSAAGKVFGSLNGGGSAQMASACTVGSVYWIALVGSLTGMRLYTCIEGGSVVQATALVAASKYSIGNAFGVVGASGSADFFAIAGSSIFDWGVYNTDTIYTGGSGSFSPPSTPLTGAEANLLFACPLISTNDVSGVQADLVRAP